MPAGSTSGSRVPPGFELLAEAARKRLSGAFSRGTLHVNLAITSDAGPPRPRINEPALSGAARGGRRGCRLPTTIRPPSFDALLGIRGVVELAEESRGRV